MPQAIQPKVIRGPQVSEYWLHFSILPPVSSFPWHGREQLDAQRRQVWASSIDVRTGSHKSWVQLCHLQPKAWRIRPRLSHILIENSHTKQLCWLGKSLLWTKYPYMLSCCKSVVTHTHPYIHSFGTLTNIWLKNNPGTLWHVKPSIHRTSSYRFWTSIGGLISHHTWQFLPSFWHTNGPDQGIGL